MQASRGVEPSLAELQERLDEAVARENYQAAAELRDKITCGPAPAAVPCSDASHGGCQAGRKWSDDKLRLCIAKAEER